MITKNKQSNEIIQEMATITNKEFGFLGDEKRYNSLFDFVKVMLGYAINPL